MNYHEFTDEALLMMHYGTRGALAVDDELTKLGAERRFRVRETSDWRKHADDLEAEMSKRGIVFEALAWSEVQNIDGVSACLLYTSPSPRDGLLSRMPSSA